MFPLKNTEAYIHANGFRSTLGKELADRDVEIQALTNKLEDEAKTRSALGAKNFIPYPYTDMSKTLQDITFIVASDGKITASGTSSGTGQFYLMSAANVIPIGRYILSFQGSLSNCAIAIRDRTAGSTLGVITNAADAPIFEITSANVAHEIAVYINIGEVNKAVSLSGGIMVRLATDADSTYQPYAPTNLQLENNKANKSDLASISITGTTNSTGATIVNGTYFYLNGELVVALKDIASNAAFTQNTNYELVTAGVLNAFNFFKSGTVKAQSSVISQTSNGTRWIQFFLPTKQSYTFKIYLGDGSGTEITSDFTVSNNTDGYFAVYTWSTTYDAGVVVKVEFTF